MKYKIEITKIINTDDIIALFSYEPTWVKFSVSNNDYAKAKKSLTQTSEAEGMFYLGEILTQVLELGGTIDAYVYDEDKHYKLTLDKLLNGIKRNAIHRLNQTKYEYEYGNYFDYILQYAIFHDIVYGV